MQFARAILAWDAHLVTAVLNRGIGNRIMCCPMHTIVGQNALSGNRSKVDN